MAEPLAPIVFTNIWGEERTFPPTRLPEGLVTQAQNVLLEKDSLGRRRPSLVEIDLTSGPSDLVRQVFRHQPGIDETGASGAELWAWSDTTTIHRRVNATWSSVTVSDTAVAWSTSRPYAATFNGKLFLAYNSDVNRLHVWDGTSVRRVGIAASAAPTVADTGSGSYAATPRYYKAQFKIKSGSNVIATSELSASVSFTPSGSGTAARVTKPTTPDSATHWRVFGSADDITFYELGSSDIAVGTTTYDDSAAPADYSDGAVAPTVGLSVPPPSAKYLLSADNRLFMAGCHETTATSTQTATRNSRVWFTAVLGARDNTGEDEAIVQTVDLRHWIDCGENDGDAIIGLGGPLDGMVYVFKRRSIWRLTPTGNVNVPYRADLVSSAVGARVQDSVVMGEDGNGNPALYFMSHTGPKRISSGYGVEELGQTARLFEAIAVWHPFLRMVWFIDPGEGTMAGFQPEFEQRVRRGVLGGWTFHVVPIQVRDGGVCLYEIGADSVLEPVLSGGLTAGGGSAYLASLSGESHQDFVDTGDLTFTPKVVSAIYQPAGMLNRVAFGPPILEWTAPDSGTGVAHSVSVASVITGPLAVTGTMTDAVTNTVYGQQATVQEKLESVQLSDAFGIQCTVAWDTTATGLSERPRIVSLTVPVVAQEPS